MKTHGFVKLVLFAAAALIAVACSKGGSNADGLYQQADTPDNLKGLLDTIVKASEGGDVKKAAALTRNLICDEAAYKKVLKDDQEKLVKEMAEAAKKIPEDDAAVAKLLRRGEPDRTEIQVHGATTEEIAAEAPAAKEFPGGAVKAAKSVMRPGVKFYEVEFLKPGKDMGMKYHLFFWDGARWKMLGPIWRSLGGSGE